MMYIPVYLKWRDPLSLISKEDVGTLIFAMMDYAEDPSADIEIPEHLKLSWGFIKNDLEIMIKTYDKRCETSAINGKKGGRPRKNSTSKGSEKNLTQNLSENLKKPKKPKKPKINNINKSLGFDSPLGGDQNTKQGGGETDYESSRYEDEEDFEPYWGDQ